MNKKTSQINVATIVGTRPELIRLSRIIHKFDNHFNHILIHTGQNYDYELNEIFFKDLKIRKPDYFLGTKDITPSKVVANVIIKTDDIFKKINIDAVLILGDTNSCLAAYSAKRNKIPVFHMEAGNRCFDERVPEEINRRIIDHIADINLPYSNISRDYLIKEGINPNTIIKTGSPMFEVLEYNKSKISRSKILTKLNLKKNNYFCVSLHREENIDDNSNIKRIFNLLEVLSKKYKKKIIISTHPRTNKKFLEKKFKFNSYIKSIKPLGFLDYNNLQINSKLVLSDSGTITEESSILKFKALNLRETHERPEGMEEGSVMMVGLNIDRIIHAINSLDIETKNKKISFEIPSDYRCKNVSDKMVRIIVSYIDYVNKNIWKKN